jgi:hypothetical protein
MPDFAGGKTRWKPHVRTLNKKKKKNKQTNKKTAD